VAAVVPEDAGALADVGAGDGQLALHLLARGHRVVATERTHGPFERLRARSPDLDCRLGDGLSVLKAAEVEGVVLAGMGGGTIARVLADALTRTPALIGGLRWLVLQPQQGARELVGWLSSEGFRMLDSTEAAQGGRSYTVLLVAPPL
jgi:tRNA (adenine22-N1)-methyltransferase